MKIPQSCFEILSKDLLETVRCWRNQPRIRRNMLSTNEITECEQEQWSKGLQNDMTRLYFVYFQDSCPLGMLYFNEITEDVCSWGCYLGEEAVWPGSGLLLEVAALDYAFKQLNVKRLNAEVFEFNVSAKKMHQFFEYSFEGVSSTTYQRDDGEYHLLKYFYLQHEWIERRERILDKLPRQINAAAKKITFGKSNRNGCGL